MHICEVEIGVILDRESQSVLIVDQDREPPDQMVARICLSIITAINTCAGFKAHIKESELRT